MKLAIMFSEKPEIEIRSIPDSIDSIEDYIEEELGYDLDKIQWQYYEDYNVKVYIH